MSSNITINVNKNSTETKKKPVTCSFEKIETRRRPKSVSLVIETEEDKQFVKELRERNNRSIAEVEKELFENSDDESDFEISSILNHKDDKKSPFVIVGNCHVVESNTYRRDEQKANNKTRKYNHFSLDPNQLYHINQSD